MFIFHASSRIIKVSKYLTGNKELQKKLLKTTCTNVEVVTYNLLVYVCRITYPGF